MKKKAWQILKPYFGRHRNEGFFLFFVNFIELVQEYPEVQELIEPLFQPLLVLYNEADLALEIIRKSKFTAQLEELDLSRDKIYLSGRNFVKGYLYSDIEEIVIAATNLMLVFNQYGNVPKKNYSEETAAIINMIQEFRGKYAPDIDKLDMSIWVNRFEDLNNKFKDILIDRETEKTENTKRRMKEIRVEMEDLYAKIVRCIEVEVIMNESPTVIDFIDTLNFIIQRYRNEVLVREGKVKAKKEKNKKEEENNPTK